MERLNGLWPVPHASVDARWAGVDNVREQKKLEPRKMFAVGAAGSPASSAGCVSSLH